MALDFKSKNRFFCSNNQFSESILCYSTLKLFKINTQNEFILTIILILFYNYYYTFINIQNRLDWITKEVVASAKCLASIYKDVIICPDFLGRCFLHSFFVFASILAYPNVSQWNVYDTSLVNEESYVTGMSRSSALRKTKKCTKKILP